MLLHLLHPMIEARGCGDCQKFQYDDSQDGSKQIVKRRGKPLERISPPPCRTKQGCPKGTPEDPKSLSPRNQKVYAHYQRCKAVGRFPDDSLVADNAAIIASIEESVARQKAEEQTSYLKAVIKGMASR